MDTVVKHIQGYGSTTLLYMAVICCTAPSARSLPITNESHLNKHTGQYPNFTAEQDYGSQEHPRFRRDAAGPSFIINDEFANETTLPYERGNIRISNCTGAYVSQIANNIDVPPTISIPEELIAITINKGVAANVQCPGGFINIPTGLVKRVADKGQCPTKNMACGAPTPSKDSLLGVCFKGQLVAYATECEWFAKTKGAEKLENAYITKLDDKVLCDTTVQFQYDVGKGKEPLPLGYMVLLKEINERGKGVKVSISTGAEVSCSGRAEEGKQQKTYTDGEEVTVRLTKTNELMRIDCHTVNTASASQVHTYFLLADGVPVVSCKEEKQFCKLPAWLQATLGHKEVTMPKSATGGYDCYIDVQVCYPSARVEKLQRHCVKGDVDTSTAAALTASAGSGTTVVKMNGVVLPLWLVGLLSVAALIVLNAILNDPDI